MYVTDQASSLDSASIIKILLSFLNGKTLFAYIKFHMCTRMKLSFLFSYFVLQKLICFGNKCGIILNSMKHIWLFSSVQTDVSPFLMIFGSLSWLSNG
jgi:hypothetical protein